MIGAVALFAFILLALKFGVIDRIFRVMIPFMGGPFKTIIFSTGIALIVFLLYRFRFISKSFKNILVTPFLILLFLLFLIFIGMWIGEVISSPFREIFMLIFLILCLALFVFIAHRLLG